MTFEDFIDEEKGKSRKKNNYSIIFQLIISEHVNITVLKMTMTYCHK
ncbi:hypothetical protein PROVRUST_05770 [Providencia rustigianii DSM 4541]|uniref:Uncharacterized protein n=1 Tax=Providencia rustigianii DSM 4541 TaxID=500637 RepID=D1P0V2_9GAMM|nr:hypothetical protein PROVRUST_05770 [Providencia rustigianii DSM 4541]